MMKKLIGIVVSAILFAWEIPEACANIEKTNFTTKITYNDNSSNIGRILSDTIEIAEGSVYRFTVDTPEDEGLISNSITAGMLADQIRSINDSPLLYKVVDRKGQEKTEGKLQTGDRLIVTAQDGKASKTYYLLVKPMALTGRLDLKNEQVTVNTPGQLTLFFTAGQRSPDATVRIFIPEGVEVTLDNVTVNVVGRGDVMLKELPNQSIGRAGSNFSYKKIGNCSIEKNENGGSVLNFSNLDLRPANGPDLKIVLDNVIIGKLGEYHFRAVYQTSEPEVLTSPGVGPEQAVLTVVKAISDFERVVSNNRLYHEIPATFSQAQFKWSTAPDFNSELELMCSLDSGANWKNISADIHAAESFATVSGLQPDKLYAFRLLVKKGIHKGNSNIVWFYSGKINVKDFGVYGDGETDDTDKINHAIAYVNRIGGGTLLFDNGVYKVRTVYLKSNVYLYIDKGAVIKAIKGSDAPEATWFSDKKYRSGLSPTDSGPYQDPENYLTKQDVGHTFFRNSMFFGERLENVKIIGNGRITGDGNLVTSDKVMDRLPDNRADKMFTFKLCSDIEIGGIYAHEDLWYDPEKDEPYYIGKNGEKILETDNMLNIDRGGHFVLLATGTDKIHVHNTYFAKESSSNARDIYDFMGCSHVTVTNIYSKVSSDDIVKLGSDCSLGYTRPAGNYKVRNIIGDTNCNLFQIGSETADDITDVCVDNIYVLGSNKAGFSISTNDGGHVKNIHLNCGHTGTLHSRSKMYRTTVPFFISISNRGRIIGSNVSKYSFTENGNVRNELLCTNVNIGEVENIVINGIDVYEVYGGSSYGGDRWVEHDGSQGRSTPILSGYKLPDTDVVEGGLAFRLPNGKHTGYIKNIVFNDVNVLVKGGNSVSDARQSPPELGVGQYNIKNLKVQPSYGIWARHVQGLTVNDCSFNYEKRDSRHVLFLNDVQGAQISSVEMVKASDIECAIKMKNSSNIKVEGCKIYKDEWGVSPAACGDVCNGDNME